MDRPRRTPSKIKHDEYEEFQKPHLPTTQTLSKKRKSEDSNPTAAKKRQSHREKATEMTRSANELATFNRDRTSTAQLERTIEKQAEEIEVLKEEYRMLEEEHTRWMEFMKKEVVSMKRHTVNVLRLVNNKLRRDMDYEDGEKTTGGAEVAGVSGGAKRSC